MRELILDILCPPLLAPQASLIKKRAGKDYEKKIALANTVTRIVLQDIYF